ncbi:MAG TPA: hypothetical protein PKN85_10645, partial [Syntrophorhabdaceae bacterium]|nr:hypothetical protein [Syntrophorhabdaceae bacterium]
RKPRRALHPLARSGKLTPVPPADAGSLVLSSREAGCKCAQFLEGSGNWARLFSACSPRNLRALE